MCVIRDFNAILEVGDRVGEGSGVLSRGSRVLREIVQECRLVDVKIQGRGFTWYRCNGKCKSRIDRALVNEKWVASWCDSSLRGLPRLISNHCPILLCTKVMDWGPRPFRFINVWVSHLDFLMTIESSWKDEGIEGWGWFIFKEKLKRLKGMMKDWNVSHFGSIDWNIKEIHEEIQELDMRDENRGLSEVEAGRRCEAMARLLRQLHNRKSLP